MAVISYSNLFVPGRIRTGGVSNAENNPYFAAQVRVQVQLKRDSDFSVNRQTDRHTHTRTDAAKNRLPACFAPRGWRAGNNNRPNRNSNK